MRSGWVAVPPAGGTCLGNRGNVMRSQCDKVPADHVIDRQSILAVAFLLTLAALVFTIAGGLRVLSPRDCRLQPHWLGPKSDDSATATSRGGAPCLISARNTNSNIEALELVTPPRNGRIDTRGKTGLIYVPNSRFKGQDVFNLKVLHKNEPDTASRIITMKVKVDW